MFKKYFIAVSSAIAITLSSCSPVQRAYDSNGNILTSKPSSNLNSIGAREFGKIKRSKKVSKHAAYNKQLQRVAARLKPHIDYPGAEWEFVVFEDKTPNAFALPGGKIGVHTGLFQITQNDAGLAAVVGHEIAHITLNHSRARRNGQIGAILGGLILEGVLANSGASSASSNQARVAYGVGSVGLGVLPFSRSQEYQADRIGALYMAKAGYDPQEAVNLWIRFDNYKKGKTSTPDWLSTHPSSSNRIKALKAFLPQATAVYKKQ